MYNTNYIHDTALYDMDAADDNMTTTTTTTTATTATATTTTAAAATTTTTTNDHTIDINNVDSMLDNSIIC